MKTLDFLDKNAATILFDYLTAEIHIWKVIRDKSRNIKTWELVYANPPALKTWSVASLKEIKGKITDEIFGKGATAHYMPIVQNIIKEDKPYSFKDYFPHLNKHFRFTSVPFGEFFITTGDDITEFVKEQEALKETNLDLEKLIKERNEKLKNKEEEIRTLQGIIPICSYCHNIRNEAGAWNRLEEYISKHTDAQFSHGICPVCVTKVRKAEGLDKNNTED